MHQPTYPLPTEEQITETLALIQKKLGSPAALKEVNKPIKQGYQRAMMILKDRIITYNEAAVDTVPTRQGRAIAALAVDYLNGEETQKMLTGITLR